MSGPHGQTVRRIFDLDFALEKGFNVTLDQVTPDDFRMLMVLAMERQKLEEEKRSQHERQHQIHNPNR